MPIRAQPLQELPQLQRATLTKGKIDLGLNYKQSRVPKKVDLSTLAIVLCKNPGSDEEGVGLQNCWRHLYEAVKNPES